MSNAYQKHRELKIVLFWSNFGPYHCARVRAASTLFSGNGGSLLPLEVAGCVDSHPWMSDADKQQLNVRTLFPSAPYEKVCSHDVRKAMCRFLSENNPDCIVIPGYAALECRTALQWALSHDRPTILMSESQHQDFKRWALKEWVKRRIVRHFDAALVGGAPQVRYAVRLGIPSERIFVGHNVVDNDFFQLGANRARSMAEHIRQEMCLPRNYFLTVCRFDRVKNLPGLLAAYAAYRTRCKSGAWGLALCGSGELEPEIRRITQTLELRSVVMPGFVQITELPIYYGLASCYVAPSLKDTWNLSVNEAMASGLPVLVSKRCGCAEDLVQKGVNGYTFEPHDPDQLADLMLKISSGAVDLKAMGEASRAIIAKWSPETFAENLWRAVKTAIEHRSKRRGSLVRRMMRWL